METTGRPSAAAHRHNSSRSRRWIRYSLRALFALVAIAALPAWWLRSELDDLADEHEAIAKLQSAGVHVTTAPAEPLWFWRLVPTSLAPRAERAERIESWPNPRAITDAEMALVGRLTAAKYLSIADSAVTNDDLTPCANLNKLDGLNLTNCRGVTNEGLRHFMGACGMKYLDLGATPVGDDGAQLIAKFKDLQMLGLLYTHVTDASMPQIICLKELRILLLPRGVTSRGLRAIGELSQLNNVGVWLRRGDDVEALRLVCRLPKLSSLTISGDGLTDVGLETILIAKGLRSLYIHGGNFSEAGLARLREVHPSPSLDVSIALRSMDEEDDVYDRGRPMFANDEPAAVAPRRFVGEGVDQAPNYVRPAPDPRRRLRRPPVHRPDAKTDAND